MVLDGRRRRIRRASILLVCTAALAVIGAGSAQAALVSPSPGSGLMTDHVGPDGDQLISHDWEITTSALPVQASSSGAGVHAVHVISRTELVSRYHVPNWESSPCIGSGPFVSGGPGVTEWGVIPYGGSQMINPFGYVSRAATGSDEHGNHSTCESDAVSRQRQWEQTDALLDTTGWQAGCYAVSTWKLAQPDPKGTVAVFAVDTPVHQCHATLEVEKDMRPASDPGRFNLLIDDEVRKANVGDGGTTGAVVVAAGEHTVGETVLAGGPVPVQAYTATISCIDKLTLAPIGEAVKDTARTVQVNPGQQVKCVIVNTRNGPPDARDDELPNRDLEFDGAPLAPVLIAPLVNDTDPDDDPLVITDVTVTTGPGRADRQGLDKVLYFPDGPAAEVVIRYTISDGNGHTDSANITFKVRACATREIVMEALAEWPNEVDQRYRHTVRWCSDGTRVEYMRNDLDADSSLQQDIINVAVGPITKWVGFKFSDKKETWVDATNVANAKLTQRMCFTPKLPIPKPLRPFVRSQLRKLSSLLGKAPDWLVDIIGQSIFNYPQGKVHIPCFDLREQSSWLQADSHDSYHVGWFTGYDPETTINHRITVPGVRPFTTDWLGSEQYGHACRIASRSTGLPELSGPECEVPVAVARSGRRLVVRTQAPGPGRVSASARTGPAAGAAEAAQRVLVARAAKRVRKAGTVRLVLKPTRAGRRLLRKRNTLRVTVTVTFKPTSGPPVRSTVTTRLRGKRRHA